MKRNFLNKAGPIWWVIDIFIQRVNLWIECNLILNFPLNCYGNGLQNY